MMKLRKKDKFTSWKNGRHKSRKVVAARLGILNTKMWPIFNFHGFKRFSKKELYGIYKYKWGYPYTDMPTQILCAKMIELGGLTFGIKYFVQTPKETGFRTVKGVLDVNPVSVELH